MSLATEYIANSLKAAREYKGLSQRALSTRAGVPQSHISKIENSAVDLRLSSLVELARVLELELTLVPRKKLPAVKAIIRVDEKDRRMFRSARKAAGILQRLEARIATLPGERLSEVAVQELKRRVRELAHFRLSANDLACLHEASAAIEEFTRDPGNQEPIELAISQLRALLNSLDQGTGPTAPHLPIPAYRIDGDDYG